MLKEIHEQPRVIQATTEGRITQSRVLEQALGTQAGNLLDNVRHVQIIACGTSYHAGMVARYWIEDLAGVPCSVEVASEFRYRKHVIQQNTLFLCISQSGETADTLAVSVLSRACMLLFRHQLFRIAPKDRRVRELSDALHLRLSDMLRHQSV